MNYSEIERQAAELQMSGTLNKLAKFAQTMPIDVTNADELNTALCTITVSLVRALDKDRIKFDEAEDSAMLHGLLLIALQIVFGGKFAANASAAMVQ